MTSHPLYILATLALAVAASEWLARHTWLRHLGSALLVIVLVALAANAGLVPTYSDEIAVYRGVFAYVAPLAIFLLLLRVHLRAVLRAGLPMLGLFVLGAGGTVAGVLAGLALAGGARAFGELHAALGGMFVATYIGGSINYNAVALEYDVVRHGVLYAGAAAADSAMTSVWMAATVVLPRVLSRWVGAIGVGRATGRSSVPAVSTAAGGDPATVSRAVDHDTEAVSPFDLALLTGLGAAAVWISGLAEGWITALAGVMVPDILILTTMALVVAQLPVVQRLRGASLAGWLAVMLFLAVIGALCDVHALASVGPLGVSLVVLVTVSVGVHGLVVFGLGCLVLRRDPAMAAVASQANIGGSTSALALARSLGREDLVLPAILLGALGNGLGTYLGFFIVGVLR